MDALYGARPACGFCGQRSRHMAQVGQVALCVYPEETGDCLRAATVYRQPLTDGRWWVNGEWKVLALSA